MTRGVIVLHGTEGQYTPGRPSRQGPTIRSSSSVIASSSELSSLLRAQLDNTGNGLPQSYIVDRPRRHLRCGCTRQERPRRRVREATPLLGRRRRREASRIVDARLSGDDGYDEGCGAQSLMVIAGVLRLSSSGGARWSWASLDPINARLFTGCQTAATRRRDCPGSASSDRSGHLAEVGPTGDTFMEVHRPNEAFRGRTTLIDY